jgi:hypothetical protein
MKWRKTMPKSNQIEMELKIREATRVNDPDQRFVDALWQKIEQQEPAPSSSFQGRALYQRPAFVILVVMLLLIGALFIGFGPKKVSAFIRDIFSMNDPGLQAVEEAGLVTDLDISAEPTVIAPLDSDLEKPNDAFPLSLSETIDDMTVVLEWVYVDEGRLAAGFTRESIPSDYVFGAPTIDFKSPELQGINIYGETISGSSSQFIFTSNHHIHVDEVGDQIDFSLDLPLIKFGDYESPPLAKFHFDLEDIPIYRGKTIPLQQTKSVSINNVEVELKSVRITPSNTELEVCYDFPPGDETDWFMPDPSLQIGNGPIEIGHSFRYYGEIDGKHCGRIGFMIGDASGAEQLTFTVKSLYIPIPQELPEERILAANDSLEPYGIEIAPAPSGQTGSPGGWVFVKQPEWENTPENSVNNPVLKVFNALREKMDGPWIFVIDIPSDSDFNPEQTEMIETPESPIDSQTQSDITVTLDWVFVDALRAGLGYTITGLPNEPEAAGVLGEAHLMDAEGNLLDVYGAKSSEIHWVEGEPGVIQGTWSVAFPEPVLEEEMQLQWAITLDGTNTMYYLAGFPIDPAATPYPMGEHPPFIPEGNVGTFTFDFTAEVHPLSIVENPSSTTVNGVMMSAPKAIVTPSMAKVMICYQKPTERDWWIWEASLGSLKERGSMSGGRVIYDTDYQLKAGANPDESLWVIPPDFQTLEHGRCILMDFLQGQSNPAEPLILRVDSLNISPPEVIPESELETAREILKAQGIEFNYMTSHSAGGGGGGGIEFTVLPEGMTDQEAYAKYNEALGYVRTGPWEITLIP